MKQLFISKKFSRDSAEKIVLVNGILSEYARLGYDLTLRQLYYQLVARGHIENSLQSYKRIGDLVSNARLAGLVDWEMIKDRGRTTVTNSHWEDPAEILEACAQSFAIDKWDNQIVHVEIMVEKQALEGVLIPVCKELDVRFAANKGYSSSSAMYETGRRLQRYYSAGKSIYLLYLGDHDPSGIDMTRDVRERLVMFSGVEVHVRRLALNYDQVEVLQPPENPAKESDSRYQAYADEFGESSWELDAIEPRSLATIVRDAVTALRDPDLWDDAVEKETQMRRELRQMADDYRSSSDENGADNG